MQVKAKIDQLRRYFNNISILNGRERANNYYFRQKFGSLSKKDRTVEKELRMCWQCYCDVNLYKLINTFLKSIRVFFVF